MPHSRFSCTACGRCCYGMLPLTVDEALGNAETFPLAICITPIKVGSRGYSIADRIGVVFEARSNKKLSLLVFPAAFIPPSMPCPNLTSSNLCGVHERKPLRCRTMPFYAYKDEAHQSDMLVPRTGWLCNTGDDAPIVYEDREIVERSDFEAERTELVKQAPALRRYISLMLQYDRDAYARILKAASAPTPGRVIVNFISFVRFNKNLDICEFARKQHPVLLEWLSRTRGDAKLETYSSFYSDSSSELLRYI